LQYQNILFVVETEPVAKARAHIVLAPPRVEPLHEVFAEAMLEDTSSHQRRSALDWFASIGVHFAILAGLLILPLYFTAGLDSRKFNLTFLAAPATPLAAPPPAPMTSSAAPQRARITHARVFTPGQLTAPSFIPKVVVTSPGSAGAPPDEALMGVPGGVPGGMPGGQVGGSIGGVLGGVLKGVPPPAPPVAEGLKVPVRVGGDVKPPHLLFGPAPEYPILARQSRLSGIVTIEAVIDEHGKVTGMRVAAVLMSPSIKKGGKFGRFAPNLLDRVPAPTQTHV
jgi:periplasmic protein TonB